MDNSKWSSEDSRFLRQIMEDFADDSVNKITVMCSAQSAKTMTFLALLAWMLVEDPGPVLWVTFSIEEAKRISKGRILPLLENCELTLERMPNSRTLKTTREIYFPGAPLAITGAESKGSLQSTPYRYLFLDEARNYPEGTIEMVSKRYNSFTHNYKRVIISTPDKDQDELHRAYLTGSQHRWNVACPACGNLHEMVWGDGKTKGGLKWDKTEETYDAEKGTYHWDALFKTIRYECWNPECAHEWKDTTSERKSISTNGEWISQNPMAASNERSYGWGGLLPHWYSWKEQLQEFLNSKRALEWGDFEPLKVHVTECRGEVWTDRHRNGDSDKHLANRQFAYDPLEAWPEEKRRIMSVDVQGAGGRHFYYVIRAHAPAGRSRLLAYGKAWSWEELKSKLEEWKVDPENMVIDSGHWAPEVYEKIVESGNRWKALKGDDKDGYRVSGKTWLFTKSMVDPAIGTKMAGRVRPIELYMWAKYGVIERMYAYLHSTLGDWQIFEGTSEDYNLQVATWDRRPRVDRHGREILEWYQKRKEDHYADCEQMQIVAAAATGLLHVPEDGALL